MPVRTAVHGNGHVVAPVGCGFNGGGACGDEMVVGRLWGVIGGGVVVVTRVEGGSRLRWPWWLRFPAVTAGDGGWRWPSGGGEGRRLILFMLSSCSVTLNWHDQKENVATQECPFDYPSDALIDVGSQPSLMSVDLNSNRSCYLR
nr:hypothetical protein [Tanacetum cinerariifolium]